MITLALSQVTVTMVAVLVFAAVCCALALWAVAGEHELRSRVPRRPDRLRGMSSDALDLVRQANRRGWRA